MNTKLNLAIILSFVSLIISAISILMWLCKYTPMDWNAVNTIVCTLSLLVTVLVGFQVYQVIDLKSVRDKIDGEINYIQNKTDYNQAVLYGIISQNVSSFFAKNENEALKYQMILKGITALKILSNFPESDKEIAALSSTLIKGMRNSASIQFSDKERTKLILMCGEIVHKNRIPDYEDIVELIKAS